MEGTLATGFMHLIEAATLEEYPEVFLTTIGFRRDVGRVAAAAAAQVRSFEKASTTAWNSNDPKP